jgi:hypothetical protein
MFRKTIPLAVLAALYYGRVEGQHAGLSGHIEPLLNLQSAGQGIEESPPSFLPSLAHNNSTDCDIDLFSLVKKHHHDDSPLDCEAGCRIDEWGCENHARRRPSQRSFQANETSLIVAAIPV